MLLTWCGAELCGPHLACGDKNSVDVCIWDTTQGKTTLCWQLCSQPPPALTAALKAAELGAVCAECREPESSKGCTALQLSGHWPWS